jgi:hypothetical protein
MNDESILLHPVSAWVRYSLMCEIHQRGKRTGGEANERTAILHAEI